MHQHFELLGNIFTLLMVLSAAYSLIGVYNFIAYGTCDPSDPSAFCLYRDLLGGGAPGNLTSLIPPPHPAGILSGNSSASVVVVEIGCLTCPYTKRAESSVSELLKARGSQIRYLFSPFPLPNHNNSRQASLALLCAANPNGASGSAAPANASSLSSNLTDSPSVWVFRAYLFDHQPELAADGLGTIAAAAQSANLSPAFNACLNASESRFGAYLDARIAEGKESKVYGTPTFFILARNYSKPLVGPVPADQLINAVDAASKP